VKRTAEFLPVAQYEAGQAPLGGNNAPMFAGNPGDANQARPRGFFRTFFGR
jgi:hypothetical protein